MDKHEEFIKWCHIYRNILKKYPSVTFSSLGKAQSKKPTQAQRIEVLEDVSSFLYDQYLLSIKYTVVINCQDCFKISLFVYCFHPH